MRIFPGRLSISRSFGDIEAKVPKYGGNEKVLISEPEIKAFKISDDYDFILMCSDGVYDKLNNREAVNAI